MENKNRFVWHDLNTKDATGAQRFYGEMFNWQFEKGDGSYLHIKAGTEMIGGVRTMGANEQMPTSWLGYVNCSDVAATVSAISGAKGTVHMPTTTMEKVGTFAVAADPTGGVFAPWKSARAEENTAEPETTRLFTFCWDELFTTDPDAAASFYTTVFGWAAVKMDMGPAGTYTLFNRPGAKTLSGQQRAAGGMMKAPSTVPHSFWLPYVHVDNADTLTEKAKRLGATITSPPLDIPNIGRFASWLDPQHAPIAVLHPQP